MPKYPEIGGRIRKLRANLSQKEMSKRLGISERSFWNYESGERQPPADVLMKLSLMFGISMDWILTGRHKPVSLESAREEVKRIAFLEGQELTEEEVELHAHRYVQQYMAALPQEQVKKGGKIIRIFQLDNITLPDPDPSRTPEDVRKFYIDVYPELEHAEVQGPQLSEEGQIYRFVTRFGTKGAGRVAEEKTTFQISIKGYIATHNRQVIENMVQQLTRIINEGDYKKTAAVQGMLAALDPGEKKDEGK